MLSNRFCSSPKNFGVILVSDAKYQGNLDLNVNNQSKQHACSIYKLRFYSHQF